MKKFFDLRVGFFVPLWRRLLVVGVCFGWALIELTSGEPFWAILFGATGASAVWQFFLTGWPAAATARKQ